MLLYRLLSGMAGEKSVEVLCLCVRFLSFLLAEDVSLNLAGKGHGKISDELYLPRILMRCQAAADQVLKMPGKLLTCFGLVS